MKKRTELIKSLIGISEHPKLGKRKGLLRDHHQALSKRKPIRRRFRLLPAVLRDDQPISSRRSEMATRSSRSSDDSSPMAVDYTVERAAYARAKPTLLQQHPGKYVVFVGEECLGPYESLPTAIRAAYQRFGRRPVYAKALIQDDSAR